MKQGKQERYAAVKGTKMPGVLAVVMMMLFIIVIFGVINQNSREYASETVRDNVVSMNMRASIDVHEKLTAETEILGMIADTAVAQRLDEGGDVQAVLTPYLERNAFYSLGIIDRSGICRRADGGVEDWSRRSILQTAFAGERVITGAFPSEEDETYINYIMVPVRRTGRITAILVASYRSEDFAQLLNIGAYLDDARSIVVDANGSSVVKLYDSNDQHYQSIVESVDRNQQLVEREKIFDANYFPLTYDGVNYFCYVSQLGVNDWYLLSFFEESMANTSVTRTHTLVSTVAGSLLFIVFIIFIILVQLFDRYRNRINTAVFEDTLLGVENASYLEVLAQSWPDHAGRIVAALDIDRFNMLNIAYGSRVGDAVLHYLDRTFREVLPEDSIYRKYGDRFIAILNTGSESEAERRIAAFVDRCDADIARDLIVPFTLSIGLCKLVDCPDLHTAYTSALVAKAMIKNDPAERWAFFSSEMRERQLQNLKIDSYFDHALKNHEFKVYYQPKFDMTNRSIIGAEALVRWVREDNTIIPPGDFIPSFEESGKILFLDGEMIEMVCQQMSEMKQEGIDPPVVSVNLSRIHLKLPQLIIKKIRESIHTYGVDPAKLSFEITESCTYEDKFAVKTIVDALHDMGCQVDMDDYGTGISGLQTIVDTDFDTVKLDGSFIARRDNQKAKVVIQSTIRMVFAMGMNLIVEGVETQEQEDFLLSNYCRYAQGYFYSKPLPREEYETLLRTRSAVHHV